MSEVSKLSVAELDHLIQQLEKHRDAYKAERDRLAAQVQGIETSVFTAFADSDVEGVDLNAMTVAELTNFVMAAIRGEGGRS